MSFAHTASVFHVESLTSTAKLILSVIADHANKYGQCWPSVATIARRASLTRRTVQRHLAALLERGLLSRLIRKGRSSFFTLNLTPTCATMAHLPAPQRRTEPVSESIKEIQAVSNFEAPTADAAPVVDFEFQELPEQQTAVISKTAAPLPELIDVPTELIEDFGEVRKTKKRGPKLTRTEARALKAEADKAGFTVAQAIMTCVLRGWSRFKADWVPAATPTSASTPTPATPAVPDVPCDPQVKAAELAKQREIRALMRPVESVASVDNDDVPLVGPHWAVMIVKNKRAGLTVGSNSLRQACSALKITVKQAIGTSP